MVKHLDPIAVLDSLIKEFQEFSSNEQIKLTTGGYVNISCIESLVDTMKEKRGDSLQERLQAHIDALSELIEDEMQEKGNTPETCQRSALLCGINSVSHMINGIEDEDLVHAL